MAKKTRFSLFGFGTQPEGDFDGKAPAPTPEPPQPDVAPPRASPVAVMGRIAGWGWLAKLLPWKPKEKEEVVLWRDLPVEELGEIAAPIVVVPSAPIIVDTYQLAIPVAPDLEADAEMRELAEMAEVLAVVEAMDTFERRVR